MIKLSRDRKWIADGRYWIRLSDGFRLPIIQGGGMAVTIQNDIFAFGDDDGSESGHTLDTENVNRTAQAPDVTFLIRISVEETDGGSSSVLGTLFARKNGTGGWNAVTTTSTNGVILDNDTQSRADDENTTERLTAGAGSFTAGKYDDGQTQNGTTAVSLDTQYAEFEFAIQIDSTYASDLDEFEFEVYDDGGALDSYPGTLPTVTADIEAGPISIPLDTAAITAGGQSISVITPVGEIFHIDFEDNDLLEFTSITDPDSDLSTNTGEAAMVGTYGMEVVVDDTTVTYGTKNLSPISSGMLRLRFYFDPNNITIPDANGFRIFTWNGSGSPIDNHIYLYLNYNSGTGFQLEFVVRDDANSGVMDDTFNISEELHYIEFYTTRATGSATSDGTVEWWVDGISQGSYNSLDNWDLWVDSVAILAGAVGSIDATTAGTIYFDDIIVRDDDTEIGEADAGVTVNLDTAALTAGGQSLSFSMGAVSTPLDTAALTAGGQALALSMGAIATALNTAALTAGGQALVLSMGAVTVGLSTATLTAGGQIITISIEGGPLTISLNTASITAGGQVLALAPGEATIGLNTALLTVNGQALSFVMGVATVGLSTALLTANGQAISFLMGEATIGLATAALTAGGQSITISLSTLIALSTAALTASGQPLSLSMGAISTGLNTAQLTAGGQTLSLSMGEVIVLLDTALATANGQALALLMGAVSTGLNTATLTAIGQILTIISAGGPQSIALSTALLTANGQGLTLTPGAVSALLDTAAIIANGQVLSFSMGAISTGLDTAQLTANGQVITVSIAVLQAQIYTVALLANLFPNVDLKANINPDIELDANPSPDVEVKSG